MSSSATITAGTEIQLISTSQNVYIQFYILVCRQWYTCNVTILKKYFYKIKLLSESDEKLTSDRFMVFCVLLQRPYTLYGSPLVSTLVDLFANLLLCTCVKLQHNVAMPHNPHFLGKFSDTPPAFDKSGSLWETSYTKLSTWSSLRPRQNGVIDAWT